MEISKPNEDKIITYDEKQLVDSIGNHQEQLLSSLRNKELECFEKYIDDSMEYTMIIEAQAFEIGFKSAIKMLKE